MLAPVLQAERLTLHRGALPRRRTVLEAIDCEVHAGEVLMLIGGNGAGKSTLLSALAGDLTPMAGIVRLAGRDIREWSTPDLARHRAVLMQQTTLTLDFSVEEVVRLGCLSQGLRRAEQATIVDAVLQATALTGYKPRSILSLSGGEQARVHLARSIAQVWPTTQSPSARLLLLDEPCANLDPYHQHQVCRVIREFAQSTQAAVLVSMHDLNLAAQYADRLMALANGHCTASGAPHEVLTPHFVQSCFGVDATVLPLGPVHLVATHSRAS